MIDEKRLIEELEERAGYVTGDGYGSYPICLGTVIEIVKSQPQAERTGEWHMINADHARCTNCDAIRNIVTQEFWGYCPSCGSYNRG